MRYNTVGDTVVDRVGEGEGVDRGSGITYYSEQVQTKCLHVHRDLP